MICWRHVASTLLFAVLLPWWPLTQAQTADALQARYATLRAQLSNNQFNQPLYLESSEHPGALQGDIYARIDQPYAIAGPALLGASQWCDILILHLNVKGCRAHSLPSGDTVNLAIGRKFDQPLSDAYLLEFKYTIVNSDATYQEIVLNAPKGPLGTTDYRIVLEIAPLDATRSFLHLSYAYQYGTTTQLAMQGYLSTIGRHKIGFTKVGVEAGKPIYIAGQRGVVERNTMRYYLAIVAYLDALSTPATQQLDRRLNDWYANIEKYPAQLHELSRQEYLDMKHREILRQQAAH